MRELTPIDYQHDGVTMHGLLALPDGPGPHPAIMVMYSALGMDDLVRNRTREFADMGYVALATDIYGDQDDPFFTLQGNPQLLRDRVLAGYHVLCHMSEVDKNRIAAIGYCFGGQCVLELARSGADVRAVVSFHGLLKTGLPARPGAVKAGILVLTGALDPYAPLSDVAIFQQEMIDAKADWHLTVYGNGKHAFTERDIMERADPSKVQMDGLAYDPLLDKLSWSQALAFIDALISKP
ncbi:dienelactone hydrolase family protein [Novosphingobium pentaromativorans]|uniref:Dienelactone hydrolase domain-containing protein n=1 Tax=Novosphingobium pentaromativorans US6-1 TaxID=1088721 RepID=G6E7Y1_9SPHN|nr:dienelactone hydrolase family protein [Novosphingobium pentaromativorans]EHJ62624.1 hypothetical protein NSU_0452 [Novosphingobium pentaromativorans US6-1]